MIATAPRLAASPLHPRRTSLRTRARDRAAYWKRRLRTRLEELERGDLGRAGRKATVAWILWAVPTESRGADPEEDGKRRAVGAVIGSPQKLGLLFEQPLGRRLSIQLHGGTDFQDLAAGGRLLLQAEPVQGPYLLAGGGVVTRGGRTSETPYFTAGIGARVGSERLRFFAEAAWVRYPSASLYSGPALCGGVLASGAPPVPREPDHVERKRAPRRPGGTRTSVFVGFPYLVGFGMEHPLTRHTSVAWTVGSVVSVSTATVRAIVGAQDGTGFYLMAGGGAGIVLPFGDLDTWGTFVGFAGVGARWMGDDGGFFAEYGRTVVPGGASDVTAPLFAVGAIIES